MNERGLISAIASLSGPERGDLLLGIGDDCAVVRKNEELAWLLTMDTLVEGIHFDRTFHPPLLLGRKSVSVNVSDIGAMGGTVRYCLLSLSLPADFDESWFRMLIRGVHEACQDYGCQIVGGDTVRGPAVSLTLTVIGECPQAEVVYRSGAQTGDRIWVSGPLGRAAAGLHLLQEGHGDPRFAALHEAHLNPIAQTVLGRQLARSGLIHAMMDLSDGLATDLAHLCQRSGKGARLETEIGPADGMLKEAARLLNLDPIQLQLFGGEDYELLIAGPRKDEERIRAIALAAGKELHAVGEVVQGEGVVRMRTDVQGRAHWEKIDFGGYDHFESSKYLAGGHDNEAGK